MGVVVTTLAQWFKENPNIAAEWDGESNTHIDPEVDGMGVNQKAWWICPEGHRYDTWVFSRTLNGVGCPYCKGKRTLAGYNDLATFRPDVLEKWDFEKNTDITPQEVTEFSHKEVWWKCEKGHSWQARVGSVASLKNGNSGCPYCSGKYAITGETDLATRFPEIAAQWCYELNTLTPEQITYGSHIKVWWKCEKGHTWQTKVESRTGKQKVGCPYCSGYRVWAGYNDLATTHPQIAAEWNYEKNGDLKPTDVSRNYRDRVWWKCSEGHEWQTTPYARAKKNGTNCPVCFRNRLKKVNRDQ